MMESVLSRLDATSIIIFLIVFLIAYCWLTTPANLPPGPPWLPVVGNFISLMRAKADFPGLLKKWHQQYGDIFTLRMGEKYLIIINSYKMMQEVFVKHGDKFSNRPTHLYSSRRTIAATGQGVMFGNGHTWKALRRLTLMTLRDLGVGKKSLEQRVQEEARAVIEVLGNDEGKPVVLKPLMSKFSSNITCSVVLGNRFDYDDASFIYLTEKIAYGGSIPAGFSPVNFIPLLRFIPAFEKVVKNLVDVLCDVDNFLGAHLEDHEATYDPDEIRDFVDLYIKTQTDTNDSQLYTASIMRRVIIDLLVAGTETTANTLEWTILHLIAHPEVQKRCQLDVDRVIDQGRLATMEDQKDLPYIQAVITESMRLTPSVPLGLPHFTETGEEIGGYTIPANSIVVANIGIIQQNPVVFPEPHIFKPERFLDKDGKFCPPKDNFVPFSIGPRICLGESLAKMELFILIVTVLQSFNFTMAQGHEPDFEGKFGITYSAKPQPVLATRHSVNSACE